MPRLPAALRPLFPQLKSAHVRATRALSGPAIVLSRLAGGHLPAGAVDTMAEAARRSGGRCTVARQGEIVPRPAFEGHPAGLVPLEPAGDTEVPAVSVAELPGGRVLGPHRAVISGTGDLVLEACRYFGTSSAREHPVHLNPFPGPPVQVPGRLGVLAARGDRNYYHFLVDVVPRLGVMDQAGSVSAPDQWYVPATSAFQRELLAMVGIGPDLLVDADVVRHVRADCLVVPGIPSLTGERNPPWVVRFLRQRLLTQVAVTGDRTPVYVTRHQGSNNRAVRNEDALLARLAARGFRCVDAGTMTVADQIRTFATASCIVAPHGAALANLAFASPGTTVVELFPAGAVLPDYWKLASGVPGLRYRYLSAWSARPPRSRQQAIVSDIVVDLDALERLLDAQVLV